MDLMKLPSVSENEPRPSQRDGTTCVVLFSYAYNQITDERYAQIKSDLGQFYDVYLFLSECDNPDPDNNHIVCASRDEIFLPIYGEKSASLKIVPGNSDLNVLAFWRKFPGYRYYWICEYDVYSPSGFGKLHNLNTFSDADVLCTQVTTIPMYPDWPHWSTLKVGALRDGRSADVVTEDQVLMGFMPLARLSADLLATLDWSYRNGWAGHYEVTMTTIAKVNAMTVESINALSTTIFRRDMCRWQNFNYISPVMVDGYGFYHPVKSLDLAGLIQALATRAHAKLAAYA